MTIEQDIAEIKSRNQKVEMDKRWETSKFRKICILVVTYILACGVMAMIGVPDYYLNALIPTLGFFLSTLSLGFAKRVWLNCIYKNK